MAEDHMQDRKALQLLLHSPCQDENYLPQQKVKRILKIVAVTHSNEVSYSSLDSVRK
jgi:hypothetical protein